MFLQRYSLGIGGDLIWTGVIKAISENDGKPVVICKKPKLSDLLAGRLYNGYESLSKNIIFINNPTLIFSKLELGPKPLLIRLLDRFFDVLIYPSCFKRKYEWYVFNKTQVLANQGFNRLVHIDMLIHSYAKSQTSKRMIWKKGGHAIQVIAKNFSLSIETPMTQMYFLPSELDCLNKFISAKVKDAGYLVIEPGTNIDWFGDLRAWPFERWQSLVSYIEEKYPKIAIVQVGLSTTPLINGLIDLRDKTSFRQATLLIKNSLLFVGTEGGLMHAAAAVKSKSIILWGGVTLPNFAGYPHLHKIISNPVPCAPCGQLGWCDNDRICMKSIELEMVQAEVSKVLDLRK